MSAWAYATICFFIVCVAVHRLNSLPARAARLRKIVLVLLAVGAFGGMLRPFAHDVVNGLSDVMFAAGILISMIARYYCKDLYADREQDRSIVERMLGRIK